MNPSISFIGEPVVRSFVELFAMMCFLSVSLSMVSRGRFRLRLFLKNNSNYTVTGTFIQVVKCPILLSGAYFLYRILHKKYIRVLEDFNSAKDASS